MSNERSILQLLQEKFHEARAKNPQYSLRAYARRLGLVPSALSEVLNGRRRVTLKMARKILSALDADPLERQKYLDVLSPSSRRRAKTGPVIRYTQLSADQFKVVADGQHYAILCLAETQGYQHDPHWIARRLAISAKEAREALRRLSRLGMLTQDSSGEVRIGAASYHSTDEIADISIRRSHAQTLEQAAHSLQNDPVDVRDFTSLTVAVDPELLPEVKRKIRRFRDELNVFLNTGRKRQVYKLSVQWFPVSVLLDSKEIS